MLQRYTKILNLQEIFVKIINKCYYFLDFSQFCPIIHNKIMSFSLVRPHGLAVRKDGL